MELSPSKRRKVSPTMGVPVGASDSQIEPSKRDLRAASSGRASFMSPTKASLARYNPSLLPRPVSAGGDGQRVEQEDAEGRTRLLASSPTRRLNAFPLRATTPNERIPRLSASPVRGGSASPRRASMHAVGGSLSAPPRRASRTPGRLSDAPTISQRNGDPNSTTTAADQMNAEAAVDRQLSQELEATAIQAAAENAAAESDQAPLHGNDDLELPPTPEQLGLRPMPSPPRGILSSSPTARKSKRKANKSSPLKPRAAPPKKTLAEPMVDVIQESQVTNNDQPKEVTLPETQEVVERKKTMRQLKTQLEAIRSDISVLETATLAAQSPSRGMGDTLKLVSIITNNNPTHKSSPPAPKPPTLSAKLALFLPFSKRIPPKEPAAELQQPLPSYHPIEVDDPLPQLRAHHSLFVTSSDSIAKSSFKSNSLLRQRNIRLRSPQSLLLVDIILSINTNDDSVADVSLESLSPWAHQELGLWAKLHTRAGDISTIGWACGRYWELSLRRARVWSLCCERFSNLVLPTLTSIKLVSEEPPPQPPSKSKRGQAKGRRQANAVAEDNAEDTISLGLARSQLRAHLGRQSLSFYKDGVSIVFRWEIGFDWTGEAESRVQAETAFPGSWIEADKRASLKKVNGVFRKLANERGVSDAIRVIVGLVWPGT